MSDSANPTATQSSPVPPTIDEIRAATRASVQAKIAASALDKGKKKRKAAANRNDNDDPPTYAWYGRNLVRNGCGPFERFHPVVEFGVRYEITDPDERVAPEALGPEERRFFDIWEILKAVIPGLADDMINLGGDVQTRRSACAQLEAGAKGCRSDDTGGLKIAILDWLLPPPPPPLPGQDPTPLPVLTPPIPKRGKKAPRGLNHPVTAAALRPIAYPDTPETYEKMKEGDKKFKILGRKLPAFMFAWGQVYDKENVEAGYLQGHTMRAAVRHIYLGPSAALEPAGSGKGKAGNAAINGVTALTARDIAYVACQVRVSGFLRGYLLTFIKVRFAMSSVEEWNLMDDEFSYRVFYWKVVESLRDDEGQAILDRFNKDVFGNLTSNSQSDNTSDDSEDEVEVMNRQRVAKRTRPTPTPPSE
ncbi:hypothetical protein R3P38DRAFT_3367058 [Favolaschia claudopus]|uniref:Uncharacterized protein n=1 Tax=Favolaschia claudopus TaxID=2862362 RepID=A0AAW0ACB4_9AGAR